MKAGNFRWILFLIALNTGATMQGTAQINLLKNGNFATWDTWQPSKNVKRQPRVPDNIAPAGLWLNDKSAVPELPETITISKDEKVKHGDNPSIKIENAVTTDVSAIGFPPFEISPNKTYKFSVWYRGENIGVAPGSAGGVLFGYAEGEQDFWATAKRTYSRPKILKGTFDWQKYEYIINSKETSHTFSLSLQLYEAKGTIWFADAALEEVVK